MKEPRFPGFTAEASLYMTNALYSMTVMGDHSFVGVGAPMRLAGGGPNTGPTCGQCSCSPGQCCNVNPDNSCSCYPCQSVGG